MRLSCLKRRVNEIKAKVSVILSLLKAKIRVILSLF